MYTIVCLFIVHEGYFYNIYKNTFFSFPDTMMAIVVPLTLTPTPLPPVAVGEETPIPPPGTVGRENRTRKNPTKSPTTRDKKWRQWKEIMQIIPTTS